MPKEVPDKVVLSLVIIAIVISLVSTYIVSVYINNIKPISNVQIQEKNIEKTVLVPSPASGYVSINVVPKKEENPTK